MSTTLRVPEQGQLVSVRQRQFVVTDVLAGSLPPDPLTRRPATDQHLVELNCVGDDGFGEELRVIWEIEPGARVIDRKSDLPAPTGFDSPRKLNAFLDAVLSIATLNATGGDLCQIKCDWTCHIICDYASRSL